ncbi:MAG: DNA-directed RNA polymerase subunit N (RpoN/RPB10) [Phycisphaerales bacterium]
MLEQVEQTESIQVLLAAIEEGDTMVAQTELSRFEDRFGQSELQWLHFHSASAPSGGPTAIRADYLAIDNGSPVRLAPDGWRTLIETVSAGDESTEVIADQLGVLDAILRRVMLSHRELESVDGKTWPIINAALFRAGIRQALLEQLPEAPEAPKWRSEIERLTVIAKAGRVSDEESVP